MKTEFKMEQSDMDKIIRINKKVKNMPVMNIGGVWTGDEKQEAINRFWKKLGKRLGFDWETVEGSPNGNLYFYANPKLKKEK